MDGGEIENREEKMGKKRSIWERLFEIAIGVIVVYVANWAPSDVWKIIFVLFGLVLILHSVASD